MNKILENLILRYLRKRTIFPMREYYRIYDRVVFILYTLTIVLVTTGMIFLALWLKK